MLRITRTSANDETHTVKLEGKLLAPWTDEVFAACGDIHSPKHITRLDLAAVDFIDSAGIRLLRDLLSHGVEIAACSAFVAELLHLEEQ